MLSPRPEPALLATYASMPVRPVRGSGSWLYEADGTRWLDAYGGHAVSSTGHSHPHVVEAITQQAARLLFYSTAVPLAERDALANALVAHAPKPLTRVFFCNSGAEANENALHVARKHTGRRTIVSVGGGWHGRTTGAAAVTDGAKYWVTAERAGMPLSVKVPFDDASALARAIDGTVAAFIVEPVQGLSGARDLSRDFLRTARQVCDATGALLIFDEVQCGAGRCGGFTAAEAVGVTPDLLTLAKGLASGVPIGALLVRDSVAASIASGDLGSTFGGGPLACAAALATIEVIDRERLVESAVRVGEHIKAGALALGAKRVLGRGLLLGLDFGHPAAELQKKLFAERVLVGTASDANIVRILAPLTFSFDEADLLLGALEKVLS
jgi:acetylornithine/N-succinyldiaminopimelate aminotransferase